jgi:predicted esterase
VTPVLYDDEPMNKDRVNVVRAMFNLPPATDAELARGIEAAVDDMARAVTFVRARSRHYNVDVSRIAVGGFSAGAMIALSAAFSERVPVAAVVSLSGRISPRTCAECVTGAVDEPAVLMFIGEKDLPVILDGSEATQAHFAKVGLKHRIARLPGATHFYPKTTAVPGADDVEHVMAAFLYEALRLGTSTPGN